MYKYVIGIDYGTLSGRAVLVNVKTGEMVASAEHTYTHAVMDETLWDGTKLPPDWALQHPLDYLNVLRETIPTLLKRANTDKGNVIGVGTDFTASSPMPVKNDGTPLCFLDAFNHEPHAYVKLWKHHAAQDKANRLNDVAQQRGEAWLKNYGGKISSEWSIPKLWQVLDEAPQVYAATDQWVEAADWIVWQLCGKLVRNSCTAGYKGIWNKRTGYPDKHFFAALDPRLENVVMDKLNTDITPIGLRAGRLTKQAAQLTGLLEGTAVSVGNVDAHVCVPAAGIQDVGKMLAIMGTSTCHMVLGTAEKLVPGMCGVVEDGILPGLFGYEAGQSCVGDGFAWFVQNCCSHEYAQRASAAGQSLHGYLTDRSANLRPGESGLIALDWWNGNRSVLVDVDLTGLLIGMTLLTKPEEIYRALIESTAFGTRMIVENFNEYGVPVDEFYAAGGISQKNPLMMQIYADVLGMPVGVVASEQGPALGSAIFAGVAAGEEAGGYANVNEAAKRMAKTSKDVYRPKADNVAVYDKLYAEYKTLHDYFGRGDNDVMKRLKALKKAF